MSVSIQIGNLLYKNFFPVYNFIYPIFKRKQDKKEIQLINSILKPGFHVLDIGANIGFYTTIFSQAVGANGRIYAFEPEPINFKRFQKNCNSLKNVSLINKAVSDKTGVLKIYLSKMLNVDHRTYAIDDYAEIKEIDAITIDDYLAQHGNPPIGFIKIDIQGYEMAALKGMINTLKKNPGVKIISELWPFGLRKAGSSAVEVIRYYAAENFNVYLLSGEENKLLTEETVLQLEDSENVYYNIFVSKS